MIHLRGEKEREWKGERRKGATKKEREGLSCSRLREPRSISSKDLVPSFHFQDEVSRWWYRAGERQFIAGKSDIFGANVVRADFTDG